MKKYTVEIERRLFTTVSATNEQEARELAAQGDAKEYIEDTYILDVREVGNV
jgi:hypothetical protein